MPNCFAYDLKRLIPAGEKQAVSLHVKRNVTMAN